MSGRLGGLIAVAVMMVVAAVAARAATSPAVQGNGWTLPADADTTKNPLTVDAKLIAAGKALFKDKCQRCHGPGGLGDGADADPDAQDEMNLTDPKRADRNSEGVIFYKVSNGRKKPKMPAFKEELTKDQIWTIVSFVQTLRRPS